MKDTLVQQCLDILKRDDIKNELKNIFKPFIDLYPELFKKIITKQDLTPFQNMLEMLDRMGDGTLSQHQASVIVGQKLVDQYVKPQLK